MTTFRAIAAVALGAAALAAPAQAVVGGTDAPAGAYPAVAYISFGGSFSCTGTLVAADAVLTAGHCGSLTGSFLATPIGWAPSSISVTLGAPGPGGPGEHVTVSAVRVPGSYLGTTGSDVSLLLLAAPAHAAPVHVAGRGEERLWKAGTLETIVGYGTTSEGGSLPSVLQQAKVPIVADGDCAQDYSSFDPRTMLCAGFPQGGVDTCQGDSGGPLFGHRDDGSLVVVGSTSQGDGCARAGKPGVYARVADTTLREWIRSVVPAAVDPDVSTKGGTPPPPGGTAGGSSAPICRSTRTVTVSVPVRYRKRLRSVQVLVAGRRVKTLHGRHFSTRVGFAGLPKGTAKVQLVMTLRDGRRVTDTRRFKVCGG